MVEFGRLICRRWNNDRPAGRPALKLFKIYCEQRPSPPPGQAPPPWGEQIIGEHHCF